MPSANQIQSGTSVAKELRLPWEVGGFFEAREFSHAESESIPWPHPNVFFALARHVVPGILRIHTSIRKLWVPDYFCPDVIQHWSALVETMLYRDDPTLPEPDWKSLQPEKDDLVVAVNYFGVRHKEPWQHWHSSHNCILLEDHSHDPVSPWALTSRADYVFSSLRKSMPITDGAICWSPVGRPLAEPQRNGSIASELKFAAMTAKADFLAGRASAQSKSGYRELYAEGDRSLEEGPESPISERALEIVRDGVPTRWRHARERNVRTLLRSIMEMREVAKPLFVQWPPNAAPFAVVLIFPNGNDRDQCRSYLEANNVFCPIHWSLSGAEPKVFDISSRVLSIPADQRYDDSDMEKIAAILAQWNLARQSNN